MSQINNHISLSSLQAKASEIENKLSSNKINGIEVAHHQRSSKQSHTLYTTKIQKNIYFDSFRTENSNIPKVNITRGKDDMKQLSRYTISNESIYSQGNQVWNSRRKSPNNHDHRKMPSKAGNLATTEKNESTQYHGIMSLLDEECFEPIDFNEDISEIKGKKSREFVWDLPRKGLNLNNGKEINPYFFKNHYLEYIYEDKGANWYRENTVIQNWFEQTQKRDNVDKTYFSKVECYLKTYTELIELEKKETEESKNVVTGEGGNDNYEKNSNEDKERIKIFASNIKHDTNKALKEYRETLLQDQTIIEPNKDISITDNETIEDGNNHHGYGPSDISFSIYLQGVIWKNVRSKSNSKRIERQMTVNGPIATWYRYDDKNKEIGIEKGCFDIRNIEFIESKKDETWNKNETFDYKKVESDNKKDENAKRDEELGFESFTVSKVRENGKERNVKTEFKSWRIKDFKMKTFRYFFKQLKEYYTDLKDNIACAVSYSVLNFLSNPLCTTLELPADARIGGILKHINWHNNWTSLTINSLHIKDWADQMRLENWECQWSTLSIYCVKESPENISQQLSDLLSLRTTCTIRNIHFTDCQYDEAFYSALKSHIMTFYHYNPAKYETIPIWNLSWKRSPNQKENTDSDEKYKINLERWYDWFMYLLGEILHYNKDRIPEIFNVLDWTESVVSNDIDNLCKIILEFKIIRTLNISNTKLYNDKSCWLFSKQFLKNLTCINDFEDVNFSWDIYPIWEKIYCYGLDKALKAENKNNEYSEYNEITKFIVKLFKRFKFFQGFYFSSRWNWNSNNANDNDREGKWFMETLEKNMEEEKEYFCDNYFIVSNSSKN